MHRLARLPILSVVLLFPLPLALAGQPATQASGIFVINPFVASSGLIDPSMLTDPYVNGIFVSLGWDTIETSEGVYNWTLIDNVLDQARENGKVVTLGIMAGYTTPAWVYADGAQPFYFLWDKVSTQAAADLPALCTVQTIPIPWDPIFLSKWQAFVQALGVRYSADRTLVNVMLYGMNFHSVETSLPITNGQLLNSGTVACVGYDYPALWQAAGYTRTLVENALVTMQGYFQTAFPQTQVLAGLNPAGFPPIDENGALMPGRTADTQVPTDMIASGSVTFGARFAAGDGGLSATGKTWSLLSQYASIVDTGYQTTAPLGAALPTALNAAIAAGARWFQLYSSDILAPGNSSTLINATQTLN